MHLNKDKIKITQEIYKSLHKWKDANEAITNFFENNPKNRDFKIVLIKVLLIDGLYKTNLKNPDAIEVAKKIVGLTNLDENLIKHKLDACISIADCKKDNDDKKRIFLMSFASKYCHFHNKEKYPIYDKYVVIALKRLGGYVDKRDFGHFIGTLNKISEENNVNFEDLDIFLWLYGQKIYIKKQIEKGKILDKIDINKEVKILYAQKEYLFNQLE
jgi:hypothetical protein